MKNPSIKGPGRLLALSGSYWETCTLHAAVKLDLFTVIGNGEATAEKLAASLEAPVRSLAMLLNALCAMELLEKNDRGYVNSHEASEFLSKKSPRYTGHMIMHHHHLVESWSRLDQAVKTGKPVRRSAADDPERRESFLMGMFNIAMATAPELVPTLDLSGRRKLLDLGGGPGTYSVFFCKHNPGLNAVIFDLPTTGPFAEKTISRFKQQESISFEPGDFTKDALTGTYDVVWLSHILHGESPDECERIINKAVSVLEPGGMIIIHEFILDDSEVAPLFPALFSLNMLLGTEGGQAYSQRSLTSMLTRAGIGDIERTPYCGPTQSGLLTGKKI